MAYQPRTSGVSSGTGRSQCGGRRRTDPGRIEPLDRFHLLPQGLPHLQRGQRVVHEVANGRQRGLPVGKQDLLELGLRAVDRKDTPRQLRVAQKGGPRL